MTSFETRWKSRLQQTGEDKGDSASQTSEEETPPRTPTPDSALQGLREEKNRVQAERRDLAKSPKMLLAHREIPLAKARKLEGTIDRLIQIQSQQTSPNSTFSPLEAKQSEDEFSHFSDEKTLQCPKPTPSADSPNPSHQLLQQNRTLESLLSESQRKIQELVSQNSDLAERQEVLQHELRLTVTTLEQCRDFKLACGDYVRALEKELGRARLGRGLHFEEILRSFAERIETWEEGGEGLTEEKLREIEEAAEEVARENAALKAKVQQVNGKNQHLKTKLQESMRACDKLSAQKLAFEDTISALEKASKVHQSEQRSLQQRLKSASDSHKEAEETLKSLTNEVNRLTVDLQNAAIRCQKAESGSRESERPIGNPDTQVAYLLQRKENEELLIERKRLLASVDSLQKQVQKTTEELRIERQSQETASKTIADLTAKKADCDKLRSALKKEETLRKRLESELTELKSQASTETSKQTSDLESTAAALKTCKLQFKRATDKLQHLQTLREQMQDALTAATTQVAGLQEQVGRQLETLREKDKSVGKSERKVCDLEVAIAAMQTKYEGWEEKLRLAEDRESEFLCEIQRLKAELAKRPRPQAVPEAGENVELRGYFETWLQTLPPTPQ